MKKILALLSVTAMVFCSVFLNSCSSGKKPSQTVSIQTPTKPQLVDDYGVGFMIEDDGTLTVTSYESGDKDVSIPSEYDGRPVKSIHQSAFKGMDIITATIPEGLEEIGAYAFALCTKLEVVNIPDGVRTIGENAFFADFGLKAIEIPDSAEIISTNAFNASGLEEITIPENVVSVGEFAFADCTNLETVEFTGDGTVVASNAFDGSENVNIIAPKGSPVIDVAKEKNISYTEI